MKLKTFALKFEVHIVALSIFSPTGRGNVQNRLLNIGQKFSAYIHLRLSGFLYHFVQSLCNFYGQNGVFNVWLAHIWNTVYSWTDAEKTAWITSLKLSQTLFDWTLRSKNYIYIRFWHLNISIFFSLRESSGKCKSMADDRAHDSNVFKFNVTSMVTKSSYTWQEPFVVWKKTENEKHFTCRISIQIPCYM